MKKLGPNFIVNERTFAAMVLHSTLCEDQNMEGAWEQYSRKHPDYATPWPRHLLLSTMRYLGPVDAWIASNLRKPIGASQAMVQHALRLGVVQMACMQEPPHAVVNEMVELVKRAGGEPLAGLVNAVLKKAANLSEAQLNETPAAKWVPKWWQKDAVGIEHIAAALQSGKPPLDICVKEEPAQWAKRLQAETVHGNALRLHDYQKVNALEGFDQGDWWVQDVAATLPALMLGEVRGKQVLDLCAAPGGKTAQLCAAGAKVTALDRSKRRVKRLEENMQRLGYEVETIVADALEWKPQASYDAILLDAPCSATGTFRRNPDVLWTRSTEMVKELSELQRALATKAAEWLKPGGVLVYAVCSLMREEGETQYQKLLELPGLSARPIEQGEAAFGPWVSDGGYVRTTADVWKEQGGMDGFFAARFTKTA